MTAYYRSLSLSPTSTKRTYIPGTCKRHVFILSFIAQALGGWALRGVIGEVALHAVFSTSFHVAAVDDDSCFCADIDDFGIHSLYPLDADTGRPICACESTLLE